MKKYWQIKLKKYYIVKFERGMDMKGVLFLITLLFVFSLFVPVNYDNNLLMAGMGTSDFGLAFVGIVFVLLGRSSSKK